MGIFSRLGTLIKSNLNELISKAEDPQKMLSQIVLDMQNQLVEAKKQVAVSIADEKRLKKQWDEQVELGKEWERKAMLAVRAGDDNLAKEALSRKQEHDKMQLELQRQWQSQKDAVEKLKDQLRTLNDKIEEAKRKKNILIARQKRAEAQKAIQDTMRGLSDNSAAARARCSWRSRARSAAPRTPAPPRPPPTGPTASRPAARERAASARCR